MSSKICKNSKNIKFIYIFLLILSLIDKSQRVKKALILKITGFF